MFLLFIDMLGMKSRWSTGGRDAAEKAFDQFRGTTSNTTLTFIWDDYRLESFRVKEFDF